MVSVLPCGSATAELPANTFAIQLAALIPVFRYVGASPCGSMWQMRQGFRAACRPQAACMSTGRFPGLTDRPEGIMHKQDPLAAPLPTA